MSTIFFPLAGCLKSATERATALAASNVRLFKDGFTPNESTPLSEYTTNEANFSGYAAKPIATWNPPMFAPGGGYMITSPLLQFMWNTTPGTPTNIIAGAYLVDSGPTLRQTIIFTEPIPVGAAQQGVLFYIVQLFTSGLTTQ